MPEQQNMHDLSTAPGVLAYLAGTPFASETATPLSGGSSHFTFRLYLTAPYAGRLTLVLKHAKPYVARIPSWKYDEERQDFEVEALARVTGLLPKDSVVTVPVVHRFDREAHAIIMNDSGEGSVSLKKLMLENVPPLELADQIGRALGEFLGHLHIWGRTNDAILDIFDANKQARTTTMTVFYGRLITTLTGKDALPMLNEPPMNVPEGHLEIISRLVSERSLAIQSSRETFTMGDFWPGNIMVTLRLSEGSPVLKRLHVLDWELAKPGLPGLDVGQFCSEMHLHRRFDPLCEGSGSQMLTSFLESYRRTCGGVDVSLARVAITQIGAHLTMVTPRVPWGSKEKTREVVKEGVEFLVNGSTGTDEWLKESIVGPLMT